MSGAVQAEGMGERTKRVMPLASRAFSLVAEGQQEKTRVCKGRERGIEAAVG